MSQDSTRNLFKPIEVAGHKLAHRVVLAPLTRSRSEEDGTPTDLNVEYYEQRASNPEGSLLITEATFISKAAGLYQGTPGIWTKKHIEGWKKVANAVHKHNSVLFMQLWAIGRAASPAYNAKQGIDFVAPSAIEAPPNAMTGETGMPRELTKKEIKQYVEDFTQAAKNAIEAGVDGVEIHSAHGYLINQFLDPKANKRTDEYGGSIENRARFLLEIIDSVSAAIGPEKVGARFSPWVNREIISYDVSPLPQFSYIFTELERRAQAGKRIAYIHVVEPRGFFTDNPEDYAFGDNNWIRLIWQGLIIRAGGLTRDLSLQLTDKDDKTLTAWGRYYIANPDLPVKLKENKSLDKYNRATFYTKGPVGYTTDYVKL